MLVYMLFYAGFHFQALAQQKLCLQEECKEAIYLRNKRESQLSAISTAVEDEHQKEGQTTLGHKELAGEGKEMTQALDEDKDEELKMNKQQQTSERMFCGKLLEISTYLK